MRRVWPLFSVRKRVLAGAEPFEDGVAAYRRGDYAAALKFWRPLAEQGHAEAQYNLGIVYYKGRGVPQDDAEAVTWYRKAAEQGYASAQFTLGLMYGSGKVVPKDYVSAHIWLNIAVAQGNDKAQNYRDRTAKRMTHGQIDAAERLAHERMEKHQQ